jgi:hypothetical protein
MVGCPQISRAALNGLAKVMIVNQPIAVFIAIGEFVLHELQAVGEEEGEGGDDGCASLVEAAGGKAGYVEDGLCWSCGCCCRGCHDDCGMLVELGASNDFFRSEGNLI